MSIHTAPADPARQEWRRTNALHSAETHVGIAFDLLGIARDELDVARRDVRRAIEAAPDEATMWQTRALAHRLNAAIDLLDGDARLDPDGLGKALDALARKDTAR